MALDYCNPDFDSRDFDERDFEVNYGGYDFGFRKLLFSMLPSYFKINDSYKDQDDKGLLERYLSVFGNELDRELVPAINCYLNTLDAAVANPKFLIHLSDSVGRPPDIFKDEDIYRNLLRYIVTFYKIKGTIKSYQLFFAILGYHVEIEELPHEDDDMYYDSGGEYDTGEERHTYDRNACLICYYYNIKIRPIDPTKQLVISTETLDKLRSAIYFNEPINCVLGTFTSTADVINTLNVSPGTPLQDIKPWVNTIKVVGTFGVFSAEIETSRIDTDKSQIIYSVILKEGDFDGEINRLELINSNSSYMMAYRANLKIVKDSESRVKINWVININN